MPTPTGQAAAAALDGATGVFLSGGDQSRLQTLVGSKVNDQLRQRLAEGLVVAGTSAGATALGRTMILRRQRRRGVDGHRADRPAASA